MESVCRLDGPGRATLIGWNRSVPPSAAALLNGTFIQGFELDDFHPYAPLHSASLVLPALLACTQAGRPVSGADFLRATVAGFEVGPRVGLALHGTEMLSPRPRRCWGWTRPGSRTRWEWRGRNPPG